MKIPVNAEAREIARLRDVNKDIEGQIQELRARQLENSEMTGALNPRAEWADPPAPEPDPEPEVPEPEVPEQTEEAADGN